MSIDSQKRFNLFSAILAGLFLLAAVGAHQNFAKKKLISYEGDNIEFSVDTDAEADNDWGPFFDHSLAPGSFIYISNSTELKSPKLYVAKENCKKLSEGRLYILFHQLRVHLG